MILSVIIGIILALCLLVSNPLKAYADTQEYQIKAAFLYNFAKFVEWPERAFENERAPIIICILGNDPFGGAIEMIKDKTIGGRGLMIKRLTTVGGMEKCHILFISASEREYLPQILKVVRHRSILTIGDMRGFAQAGGVINLINTGNRIGFEINISAAEKAGLKVSSKLLRLGKIVREGH